MKEESLNQSDKVVLQLLGMKKKWVFDNGQWIDKKSLKKTKTVIENFEMEEPKKKRFWQFWK